SCFCRGEGRPLAERHAGIDALEAAAECVLINPRLPGAAQSYAETGEGFVEFDVISLPGFEACNRFICQFHTRLLGTPMGRFPWLPAGVPVPVLDRVYELVCEEMQAAGVFLTASRRVLCLLYTQKVGG